MEWPVPSFVLSEGNSRLLRRACDVCACREAVIVPAMHGVVLDINHLAKNNAGKAMLARTHGQPATPTTLGKEMANFR